MFQWMNLLCCPVLWESHERFFHPKCTRECVFYSANVLVCSERQMVEMRSKEKIGSIAALSAVGCCEWILFNVQRCREGEREGWPLPLVSVLLLYCLFCWVCTPEDEETKLTLGQLFIRCALAADVLWVWARKWTRVIIEEGGRGEELQWEEDEGKDETDEWIINGSNCSWVIYRRCRVMWRSNEHDGLGREIEIERGRVSE